MAHFPTWWLVWLAVVVVLAIVRSDFVRKASARREQERRERMANRPARPARLGSRYVGAARQSPAPASGQPLVTRDQLVAAGAIIPAADADALPTYPIA